MDDGLPDAAAAAHRTARAHHARPGEAALLHRLSRDEDAVLVGSHRPVRAGDNPRDDATASRRTDCDGEGLFDDAAVIRRVAREGLLLAGGGRATLLQIAHPDVARGVHDHSDFSTRPADRLRNTLTYAYAVLFGTRDEARTISRAVAAMHRRVTGPGYRADDPELLVWVNATLYDTALLLYQRVIGPLPVADADVCYRQYSVLATSIGCPPDAWPPDRRAFAAYWDRMIASLQVTDVARAIAASLLRPRNLPVALRPGAPLNRFVTAGLLPARIRDSYGFPWSPRKERLLTRTLNATSRLYPHLPQVVRDAPKDHYLKDLRRRLARRHTPRRPRHG